MASMNPLFLGHDSTGHRLKLNPDDRRTHSHVIGSSGSGKSKFLEHIMRQDLDNRQGFCLIDPHGTLYEAVLRYSAFNVFDREIVPLNLSEPGDVVGFNPFQRAPGSLPVDVQVDRRINATMHAWGVENTDQTPTLARTLRLIYTVMIERNLGLPQIEHLIDFNAREIRGQLIENLQSELIAKEWRELQALKPREWRDETLSARNRLCKFLTSPTLGRVMGVPGRSINVSEAIEQGKVLLVNLAPSDHLSHENARVFGALLVNELFECAMRRKAEPGRQLAPYYLYLDEFQNFVSIDIANMLDQVRKFALFLVLCHQRFGQLDENITDAVLTNCRIKTVFGGLPVESAKLMANELFINKLDPMKIKAAIYQTKFWPKYGRDKVYTHGTSHGTSSSHSSSTGGGENSSDSSFDNSSTAFFYDNWFSLPQLNGTRTVNTSRGQGSMSGRSSSWAEGSSDSDSHSESESVADVPIFIPVPFQELSSVQYFPLDEQLTQLTAALKNQFQRHCFLKVQDEETEPLLVPFVRDFYLAEENFQEYRAEKLEQQGGLPAAEIDELLAAQEQTLLNCASNSTQSSRVIDIPSALQMESLQLPNIIPSASEKKKLRNIFDDLLAGE